jgi:hypothetical protein
MGIYGRMFSGTLKASKALFKNEGTRAGKLKNLAIASAGFLGATAMYKATFGNRKQRNQMKEDLADRRNRLFNR